MLEQSTYTILNVFKEHFLGWSSCAYPRAVSLFCELRTMDVEIGMGWEHGVFIIKFDVIMHFYLAF